ncbi:uncharacterized protein BJ171DRAFT_517472 [Polychytrium aggregatum]|uniref:uncharacterized protein n=1 Tax=Polychytrium aggregatum TaxID=110093 RepID=UPI0022FDB323|nr:uncharacterized protein BJ171DRAFT_517472 [Polychytrium aggregatum]KAI9199689.1 hypothetical protein BJ171DRAFT_517472 [Polychytrium aggregatum]
MGSQGISPNDLQNPATLQTVVNNVQTASPTANSEVVYAAVLPSSFSLISSNRVGAVKNQGGCASCVGFSTSSTLESTLKTQGVNMVVSAADIFFCVGYADASCANGWSIDTAARKVSQYGFVSDSCFAYKPVQQACTFGCPQGRHLGLVSHHIPSTVEAKRHILTNGAVLTALTVYEDFMNCCSNNQVYHQGANQPLVGGHAVACVGWDDTLQAWLCQNSWDTWWGTKGFFWIGYGQSGIMGDMYGFV